MLEKKRLCSGTELEPTIVALGFRCGARLLLEFFGEGLVVEKGPRVVELVIPRPLKILHGPNHVIHLLVSYQRQ